MWVGAGIVHKYCGRSHARDALEREGKQLQAPHGCCHACRLPRCSNPVAVEQNGRVHDFCCLLHAEEAVEQGRHPKSNRKLVDAVDKWCSYPDCDKQRFRDIERGFDHDFCGRYHAAKAAEVGLAPVPADRAGKVSRVWKGRPGAPPYTLSVLTREHEKYTSVVSQFESAWKHPGRTPEVRRVLQIRNPNEVFNRYTRFKTSAGDAGEERRFHGTTLASSCSFAMDIKQPPCQASDCAVCGICATSFDLDRCGTGPKSSNSTAVALPTAGMRYGKGLYFSKVSSKSNDYAAKSERHVGGGGHGSQSRRLCAVFLCKVAVGVSHVTKEDFLDADKLADALARADSVVGLTEADGGALNYDETVVYNDDAAIPSYLIVYSVGD